MNRTDLRRNSHQLTRFHCNSVAPRPEIVWQDHEGANRKGFHTLAKIDNYTRTFESWRRRKGESDGVFSLDLVQVCWTNRRGAHLHDSFVRCRCRPWLRLDLQNIRWISVRFVNRCAYIFIHQCPRRRILTLPSTICKPVRASRFSA